MYFNSLNIRLYIFTIRNTIDLYALHARTTSKIGILLICTLVLLQVYIFIIISISNQGKEFIKVVAGGKLTAFDEQLTRGKRQIVNFPIMR